MGPAVVVERRPRPVRPSLPQPETDGGGEFVEASGSEQHHRPGSCPHESVGDLDVTTVDPARLGIETGLHEHGAGAVDPRRRERAQWHLVDGDDRFERDDPTGGEHGGGTAEAVGDRLGVREVEHRAARADDDGEASSDEGIDPVEVGHVGEDGGDETVGITGPESVQHLRRRIERDDLESRRRQREGEAARPRSQFEDGTSPGQPGDGGDGRLGVERIGIPVVVDVGEGTSVERRIGFTGGHRASLPRSGAARSRTHRHRYPSHVPAYLDHAATGPMHPDAVEAMLPFFDDRFANPSGAHRRARDARRAVDEAREELASLVGCEPGEIVYTSGGTEADNLAVFGLGDRVGLAVCSAIEHHAVLDPVESIDGRVVAVDARGRLDLDALRETLGEGEPVRVVSLMTVNNETGVIQPLAEAAAVVRELAPGAVLHSDAVQAFCWTDVAEMCACVDSFSLSAHKFGGPKGVGVLVVRDGVPVHARQLGGGQERERRSGTQNVAGIVATTVAARRTAEHRELEIARVGALRDRLLDGLAASIHGLVETAGSDRTDRAAGIAHVCIPGVESEALLFLLEREDISASAASSCASGALQSSHVLAAMGVDPTSARGSLRLSLGRTTSDAEIDDALVVIPGAVERLRTSGL